MPYLYQDPTRSLVERVDDLLARMELDEKIAQMHAFWLILSDDGRHEVRTDSFTGASDPDTLAELLSHGLGQITRPLGTRSIAPRTGVRALNRLQKFLREETRLGIPAIAHEECLAGLMAAGCTLFPSSLAQGATWNPALIERLGQVIGQEARSLGCHQGLAPVLDVSRDVRWGRTEETFGEDPYLVGVLATRYVRGLQGEKRDLLATLKHFAGHSFSEGGRNHAPVNLGWRELNDIFLLPFEMAIKQAQAGSVMPAYHDVDNEPSHASRHLLTEVLRDQWGFDGLVVADYVGISLLYQHHGVAADRAEAAALAFNAGLDIELPGDDCAIHLKTALRRGLITIEKIDGIVRRILTEKFRLGLFEKPYTDEAAIALQTPAAIALATEVARQSVVILDNDGILPLDPGRNQRIAVIGPTADDPMALLGDYSFPVHLITKDLTDNIGHVVTPLVGLRRILGTDTVSYARGCYILEQRRYGTPVFPGDVDDATSLALVSPLSERLDLIPEAVACAAAADLAIVCVGDLSGIFQTGTVGEGSDTDSLDLPGVQQRLLEAVVATGKPVIVVLTSGRPYNLGGLEPRLAAQVMAFFGGQQGGIALAEVLTGQVEPSGRLTLSVPKSAGAVPYVYNHKLKSSGTPVARHFGSRYPFGHGLSYTEFEFTDLTLEREAVDIESGELRVRFAVHNRGTRSGVAVPQLYVHDRQASLVRPVKELKAFGRVALAAGAATRVTFTVPVDMLNFTSLDGGRIVEPGEFDLMVGASSGDIRLRGTVRVDGVVRRLGCAWRMESRCDVAQP
ncbi:MAG: glycoside hydrolase family 3 N-terminal domain-containing protein [Azospirillaceae bacterium]|nr:glycoside hydrolase family 3 N-terminal domain-containing protein [Azospirillaceae bacterium]